MALIEYYAEQMDNLTKLNTDTIIAYKKVVSYACHCEKCKNDYVTDFGEWQPVLDHNHTWQVVALLEGFGYTGYDYDAIIYRFYLHCPESTNHGAIKYKCGGLSFGQAVCNTLIAFANDYKFIE